MFADVHISSLGRDLWCHLPLCKPWNIKFMRGRGILNFSHQSCWLSKYCPLHAADLHLKTEHFWGSELKLAHISSNMSRVLVTGASGYVAMHIVKQLIESGKYIVRGTVRSLANEKKVKPLKDLCPENAKYPLELVEADLLKKETWPEWVVWVVKMEFICCFMYVCRVWISCIIATASCWVTLCHHFRRFVMIWTAVQIIRNQMNLMIIRRLRKLTRFRVVHW